MNLRERVRFIGANIEIYFPCVHFSILPGHNYSLSELFISDSLAELILLNLP